jgi:hypothetical protein
MYDNLHFYTFGISLLINIVFGGLIIYNQRERKRIYRILNDTNNSISEKNQAISEQAAKLSEAFENLWTINQRLDEEVLLRTDSITRQHREMIKSIHFYTHKLRGTLSSMMGLVLLAKEEDKSQQLHELLELMNVCIRQLDESVRELGEIGK